MKKLLTVLCVVVGMIAFGAADPATCGVNGGDGSIVATGDIFLTDNPNDIDYVLPFAPSINILRGVVGSLDAGEISREEGSFDLGILTDGVLVYSDTVGSRAWGAANEVTMYPGTEISWSWPSDEPRTLNELRIFFSWGGGADRNDIVIDQLSVQKKNGTWDVLCDKGEYLCAIGFARPAEYTTVYRNDGNLNYGDRTSRMLRIFSGDDDDILAEDIIGLKIVFGYQDHGYGGCCEIEARGSMSKTAMGPVEIAGDVSKVAYSASGDIHQYTFTASGTIFATDDVTIQGIGSLLAGETYRVVVPSGETRTVKLSAGYSLVATAAPYPLGVQPAAVRKNVLRGLTGSLIEGGFGEECQNDMAVLTDGVIPLNDVDKVTSAVSLHAFSTLEWTWDDPMDIDTIRIFGNWGGGAARNDIVVRRLLARDESGIWNVVGAKANGLGFMPYFGYSTQRDLTTFLDANGNIDFGGRGSRCVTISSAKGLNIASSATGFRLCLSYQHFQYGGLVEVEAIGGAPVARPDKARTLKFVCDKYDGDEPLENFPVLIRLDEENIAGFDYRLADPSALCFKVGARSVPYEIDTWNTVGTSLVWVKVPRLAKDTVITMIFGGDTKRDVLDSRNIWEEYTGVWHLTDTLDSSVNQLDATAGNFSTAVNSGAVGGAYSISPANNMYSVLKVDLHADAGKLAAVKELGDEFTVSFWMKAANRPSWNWLISRCQAEGQIGWGLHLESPNESSSYNKWQIWTGAGNPGCFETDDLSAFMDDDPCGKNEWCHIVLNYAHNTFRVYREGRSVYECTYTGDPFSNDYDSDLFIGGCGSAIPFAGQMDEVRISKGSLSAPWIQTDYQNQTTGLCTAGSVEFFQNGLLILIR